MMTGNRLSHAVSRFEVCARSRRYTGLRQLASSPYSCTLSSSMNEPKIVCVMGPTSSGKTALGIRLAKRFFGEIINADARQLYRDAPIGTGIPTREQQSSVEHHLLGISDASEAWTVSRWCSEAIHAIQRIEERERLPIIVGGTGMYLRALTEGFVFQGEPDPDRRKHLLAMSSSERLQALIRHAPNAEHVIDIKNPHRVLRALERILAGQPLMAVQRPPMFSSCKMARHFSPEQLRARIEQTIDQQMRRGWVDEVRALLDRGVSLDSPLMKSIGFRVIAEFLRSGYGSETELYQAIVRDTWAYARRQMTWLRKEPRLQWVESEEQAEILLESWLK